MSQMTRPAEHYCKHRGYDLRVEKSFNRNGGIALDCFVAETGEPYCIATVDIPEVPITENGKSYAFIKNWSENEGILESLISAKIVEPTGMKYPTGFVFADLVKVLI